MAMASVYQNQISHTSNIGKILLGEMYGRITQIDKIWTGYEAQKLAEAGGTGHETERDALIQADIDSVPSFLAVKLTVAQVREAIYIVKMVKVQADTINLDALAVVSNL